MKKSKKEILEDLVAKGIITEEQLIEEIIKDIDQNLKKSIEKSKKKIKANKKFPSLNFSKEYLDIKRRLYSKRESLLRATIPL